MAVQSYSFLTQQMSQLHCSDLILQLIRIILLFSNYSAFPAEKKKTTKNPKCKKNTPPNPPKTTKNTHTKKPKPQKKHKKTTKNHKKTKPNIKTLKSFFFSIKQNWIQLSYRGCVLAMSVSNVCLMHQDVVATLLTLENWNGDSILQTCTAQIWDMFSACVGTKSSLLWPVWALIYSCRISKNERRNNWIAAWSEMSVKLNEFWWRAESTSNSGGFLKISGKRPSGRAQMPKKIFIVTARVGGLEI